MLIDKIQLENYRVYEGLNTVSFDYDHERNVTIISGNNGFGKTSFLTSLLWCLYGKLMGDVDEKYKREILDSGGYKKYCERTINRNILRQFRDETHISMPIFSVAIELSRVYIPAIPCDNILIKRTYDINTGNETIDILMDDKVNELTRELGPEIFINDFILPKEIAKFFFFDAEKIVSLAEMRSQEEKKQLSKAYTEVLGIKKYEDLKSNLENMRLRLRKNHNVDNDQKRLDDLNMSITTNERLMVINQEKNEKLRDELARKKAESDKFQEKLIREGSTITLEELKTLKQLKENTNEESKHLKGKMIELLDFAPFAIASKKLSIVYNQIVKEAAVRDKKISNTFLRTKLAEIKNDLIKQKKALNLPKESETKINEILEAHLLAIDDDGTIKILLNLNEDEQNDLIAILNNLALSYGKRLKDISQQSKINQSTQLILNNKLRNAEAKENDIVVKEIRLEKDKCDKEILNLEQLLIETKAKIINLTNEGANFKKMASELTRKVHVNEVDRLKDVHASRIIDELAIFIKTLKQQKKKSLETNILASLRKLMHKSDFVNSVEVVVGDDYLDIELYDRGNIQIAKESLSKGEQQLYATAILKALVDESNIRFPLFIDSPLQKFDKQHAHNIVTQFYPTISEQVVLFPLLEKELSEEEYHWLIQRINKVFVIEHSGQDNSRLKEIKPELLFESTLL